MTEEIDRRGVVLPLAVMAGVTAVALMVFALWVSPRTGEGRSQLSPQEFGRAALEKAGSLGVDGRTPAFERAKADAEARLDTATTTDQAREIVADALRAAGQGTIVAADQASPSTPPAALPTVTRRGTVAVLTLPTSGGDSLDAQRYGEVINEALAQASTPPCGWVIDLRGSQGTDLWRTLAATTPVQPDGVALHVVENDGRTPIRVVGTEIEHAGAVRSSLGVQKRPLAGQVAVIVDAGTRGNGAIAALALQGAPHVKIFGPALATPTVTTRELLPDGSALEIVAARYADRAENLDGIRTSAGDFDAAVAWAATKCR